MVWSSLSMVILVLGKARSCKAPNLGCRDLSHLGDLMFHQKTLHKMWCMSRSVVLWWSCQLPVAHRCGLLNHPNNFLREMFKLHAKFDADSLLYLLSHFECNSHTVHMLTQQHLPPPLTTTVKSSLFTHGHSIPLFLADRLQGCHTNCSCYINHGWTFSRQTLYVTSHMNSQIKGMR